ncbi:MAG: RNA methyltransferase [Sideroxydans sp.]|jgi:23S rRNA (adenine2503-C2)-methyltransferase
MRISQLRQRLHDLGCKPCHEDRLLRGWSQVRSYDVKGSPAETFFPAAMRKELPAIEAELNGLARLKSEHAVSTPSPTLPRPAGEGANAALRASFNNDEVARLLVELHDGQMVESVLLPRGGLCVSTQVGCAVGCVFCMSGRDGLIRQLGSAEIVAQVVLARKRRTVSKVVFMGMGEPAHNLDNVLEAIDVLGTLGGIGHKELVLSTVGDVRVFDRLMERVTKTVRPELVEGVAPVHASTSSARTDKECVKPALALSLHSTDATLRAKLLPHAPTISVEELVERAEVYARATGYPTQYQWTLIEGVNDSDAEVEHIAQLLKGKYALMNFIPFNAVDGLPYRRPSAERTAEMMNTLNRQGIYSRVRDSAGQEVEGACGQLRARATKKNKPARIKVHTQ